MRKLTAKRILVYLVGMVILAFGLTLNTKTSLGASAILSVPFTISEVFGLNFGNLTLISYILMIAVQLSLQASSAKDPQKIIKILMQLPLSLVFTRFLNLFKSIIPYQSNNLLLNILVALCAVCLTGLGIVLTINTDLIPNPGDGFVNAISQKSSLELGRSKNIVDIGCVLLSLAIGAIKGRPLAGIGIGTLMAMALVGVVVTLLNKRLKEYIQKL